MNPVWVGSCAAVLAVASATFGAQAADLPSPYAPPPAPIAVQRSAVDWTGFYVGGNLGGNVTSNYNADTEGSTTFRFDNNNGGVVPITLDAGKGGFIGGLQGGFNYQYRSLVAGAEADISAVQAGGGSSWTSFSTLAGSTLTTTASEKLNYLSTVRLRAGYVLYDRWLVFATGGLAFGGVNTSSNVTMNSGTGAAWNGSTSNIRTGYALGAGLEYALTQNITLRGEYVYYNIGSSNTTTTPNAAAAANPALNGLTYIDKTTAAGSIFRIGANYKF